MKPIGIATTNFREPTKIALELHPDHPDFPDYDTATGEHFFHVHGVTKIVVHTTRELIPTIERITVYKIGGVSEFPESRSTTFQLPADAIQNIWA